MRTSLLVYRVVYRKYGGDGGRAESGSHSQVSRNLTQSYNIFYLDRIGRPIPNSPISML